MKLVFNHSKIPEVVDATASPEPKVVVEKPVSRNSVRVLAEIAVFSGLIALGTAVLSTLFFGIPLPYPLYTITAAPAFYLSISVLYSRKVSFWSTAVGSAVGEAIGILLRPAPLIFIPGIVWARAPEALIVSRFRKSSTNRIVLAMVLATVFETLAFLIPDTFFYAYALFSYGENPIGLAAGFAVAISDIGTMVDLMWVPVALAIIKAVRRAFNVQFFD